MKRSLTTEEKKDLRSRVKKSRAVDERHRLSCVLLYDEGKKVQDIAHFLYLDLDTVYTYIKEFHDNKKTTNDSRGGSKSRLGSVGEEELKDYLSKNTYLKTKDIKEYILEKYQVDYTISGLTKTLKRLGFCYKRPATIPGKLCPIKQEEFKNYYQSLKDNLSSEEKILFMDLVHPQYQSQVVRGWILKGETKHLPTTAKQCRLHYTGAICLQDMSEIIIHNSQTVNENVVIEFLQKIQEKYQDKGVIHVICDNAMYYKSKKVKKWLMTSRIKIHHLPSYSPNLNPIERLWKILREKVCYDKYYSKFSDFREKIDSFFNHLDKYEAIIKTRINDKFQVFNPNLIKLVI